MHASAPDQAVEERQANTAQAERRAIRGGADVSTTLTTTKKQRQIKTAESGAVPTAIRPHSHITRPQLKTEGIHRGQSRCNALNTEISGWILSTRPLLDPAQLASRAATADADGKRRTTSAPPPPALSPASIRNHRGQL